MSSWSEVEAEAPELAERAREIFDAHKHKTMATLRRDGSPRISGTEIEFVDGEMWFGSMWKAVKALDLQRDSRFALHSGSSDPPEWTADAKVAGRVEEVMDPERKAVILGDAAPHDRAHVFRGRHHGACRHEPRRPARSPRDRVLAPRPWRHPPRAEVALRDGEGPRLPSAGSSSGPSALSGRAPLRRPSRRQGRPAGRCRARAWP